MQCIDFSTNTEIKYKIIWDILYPQWSCETMGPQILHTFLGSCLRITLPHNSNILALSEKQRKKSHHPNKNREQTEGYDYATYP